MKLNPLQNDRAAGVLVAMAAGDALGAGYEFGAPLPDGAEVIMKGGGPFGFAPAEWTDDTSMAIPIAEALLDSASDGGPSSPSALTGVVRAWTAWAAEAKDVGMQTSSVIAAAGRLAVASGREVQSVDFTAAAANFHARTGRSAGNGSLMRTAPLALAYLDKEPADLMAAAGVLSALTHVDADAQEACSLWCVAIRNAVLTGQLDVRAGIPLLSSERAALWLERIEMAERSRPRDFTRNGWVVEAFQGAWSAIHTTLASATSGPTHLRAALEEAVRGGRDTDTVAAIAGGLMGAAHGYSAVPFEWRRHLHGWPGMRARDLMVLGLELARGEGRRLGAWPRTERQDYSMWGRTDVLAKHPHDDGVWLGGVGSLEQVAELGIDAVVSLCRLGTLDVAGVASEDHATFWVVDSAVEGDNAHAAFVLGEAAAAVERYRAEGKTVLLHCVRAESRTPTVAAMYAARAAGMSPVEALANVQQVLPGAQPNPLFMRILRDAGAASHPPATEATGPLSNNVGAC